MKMSFFLSFLFQLLLSCSLPVQNEANHGDSSDRLLVVNEMDSINLIWTSKERKLFGTRRFPPIDKSIEECKKIMNETGVGLILDIGENRVVFVLKDGALFSKRLEYHLEKIIRDSITLLENGYNIDKPEFPIGSVIIDNGCDNIVLYPNENSVLEQLHLCTGSELINVILDQTINFDELLDNKGFNYKNYVGDSSLILLINVGKVSGSWFTGLENPTFIEFNIDIENTTYNQFQLKLRKGVIEELDAGASVGYNW
jgi:hypothetical protein